MSDNDAQIANDMVAAELDNLESDVIQALHEIGLPVIIVFDEEAGPVFLREDWSKEVH